MSTPERVREPIVGPEDGPESPYPIRLSGPIIKGFQRGSKEVSDSSVVYIVLRTAAREQ
jgi:hypothetical protein